MMPEKEKVLRRIILNQKEEIKNLKQEKYEKDLIQFINNKSESKEKQSKSNALYLSIGINILLSLMIILELNKG